jgi:pyruvate kinase
MKKTKIVATLSDRNISEEFIKGLYEAGMNVVRINTAFQSIDGASALIRNVRKVSEHLAVMIDTKGPEIRTNETAEEICIGKGDIIAVKGDPAERSTHDCIYVNYAGFVSETPLKSRILVDDGFLELEVTEKDEDRLVCRVLNGGRVEGRKSVNVPRVSFGLPSLSEKDKAYIRFAVREEVDFIAHSFVRNKEDIAAIREMLEGSHSQIKVIAKIENQEGVDNIDEILDHADGVMVARGDLGIEIPYEKIPGIQRMLIRKCIERRKPVIVATQMLHSMIHNPRPTRAEVNDIASAIYSSSDAIMLSAETANGDYPLEAVSTMAKVAAEVEKSCGNMREIPSVVLTNERSAFLTKTAVEAAVELNAKAIIADTSSGSSIRNMAGFRGCKPVFAHCYDHHTVRQLALSFGVFPEYIGRSKNSGEFVRKALRSHLSSGSLSEDDLVVIMAGNFGDSFGASFIEISPVKQLLLDRMPGDY